MCVRTRFHCLCGFSAGFRQDRIIPRGPQIAPLLSSPFLSSVIYRTDTSETLRSSSSPCRNTSGNSICGSFSHAINPCDFFPSFNAAALPLPSFITQSISVAWPARVRV